MKRLPLRFSNEKPYFGCLLFRDEDEGIDVLTAVKEINLSVGASFGNESLELTLLVLECVLAAEYGKHCPAFKKSRGKLRGGNGEIGI